MVRPVAGVLPGMRRVLRLAGRRRVVRLALSFREQPQVASKKGSSSFEERDRTTRGVGLEEAARGGGHVARTLSRLAKR